jgi:hypothetical protein
MAIEKLEGDNNYLQWLSQIMPNIQSNDLEGIIDGSMSTLLNSCPMKMDRRLFIQNLLAGI